jgi:hypothetical protein
MLSLQQRHLVAKRVETGRVNAPEFLLISISIIPQGIFNMPPTALLPLRRKSCYRFFIALKQSIVLGRVWTRKPWVGKHGNHYTTENYYEWVYFLHKIQEFDKRDNSKNVSYWQVSQIRDDTLNYTRSSHTANNKCIQNFYGQPLLKAVAQM